MGGVGQDILSIKEYVKVDLLVDAQTKEGPVDLRVVAFVLLAEGSRVNSMLLGMDIAQLHKIDVDQRRKKLIFREAMDAEVDFRTEHEVKQY